ncbi:MAG: 8-amino-7-oxononanoate synthase [Phycisphaerae bacterium]|nr:8-amino-7-oxononanoate synthase [Phycisphaerae bacterium]
MQARLDELAKRDLLRSPRELSSAAGERVTIAGRDVLCLCSNDYLGLANDPAVRAAAVEAIERWGVGSGASRLISGTMSPHVELERALADFKGTEAAVVTPAGWMANHAAVTTLVGPGDLILADKLNHASILVAATASGARLRTYHHCDTQRLETLLRRHRASHRRCLIVTDSLFSMDGDLAPLREIVRIKQQYDAQLLIDEAHATGVLGSGGQGAGELLGVEGQIDVTVGTLSKAIGTAGGFVAGPDVLIRMIRNTAKSYIYTTAPPPAICAAALAALKIIQTQPQRREKLLQLAADFRDGLHAAGMDTRGSVSQIIPVVVGSAGEAVSLSEMLLEEGFFIPAIRPPTVPPATSRLRISLSASHHAADLERLVNILRDRI